MKKKQVRYSKDGNIVMLQDEDGTLRIPTQDEMDNCESGPDLTAEEIENLES